MISIVSETYRRIRSQRAHLRTNSFKTSSDPFLLHNGPTLEYYHIRRPVFVFGIGMSNNGGGGEDEDAYMSDGDGSSVSSKNSPRKRALEEYLNELANPAKIRLIDKEGSIVDKDEDDEEPPPYRGNEGPTRPLRLAPGDEWDVDDEFWAYDPKKHPSSRKDRLEVLRATTSTSVDLHDVGIGRFGAMHLAPELVMSRNIVKVDISCQQEGYGQIGTKGCLLLADAFKANRDLPLRVLNIQGNDVGDDGAKSLRDALSGRVTLEELRCGNNSISYLGLLELAELACTLPTLRVFDVDSPRFSVYGEDGGDPLFESEQGDAPLKPRPAVLAIAKLCTVNANLEELGLESCEVIWEETATILEAALVYRSLRHLRLGQDRLNLKGVTSLAYLLAAEDCRLESLSLANTKLGGKLTKTIANALENNTSLTFLDLNHADIGIRGCKAVSKMLLSNKGLRRLNLEGGQEDLGPDEIGLLSESLVTGAPALEELRLGWNNVTDQGAQRLASVLDHCPTLKVLGLEQARITDTGARALAAVLATGKTDRHNVPGSSLEVLNLHSNKIGSAGGEALADALPRNRSLKELDLSSNRIRSQGALRFGPSLKRNVTLENLNLDGNGIGARGAAAFASALAVNSSLRILSLSRNPIGADGAEALADGISRNQGLQVLKLKECQIEDEGETALHLAVEENDTLLELNIGHTMGPLSEIRPPIERTINAQKKRSEREAKDRPPPNLALPLKKWLRVADLDIDRSLPPLGQGGFGKVYIGKYLNMDVAVKEPLLLGDGEAVLEEEIGTSVDIPGHDNVAEILGYHIQPTYLVTRLYRGGDLGSFLENRDWDRELSLKLLHGAAVGMWFLHNRGIFHSDLKPANVLVDIQSHSVGTAGDANDHPIAKIADFGLARTRTQTRGAGGATEYEYVGAHGFSHRYASPEQVRAEPKLGRASDVYSFGMLCYEVLSGGLKPYEGMNPVDILFAISKGQIPKRGFHIEEDDWELIRWMCKAEAGERPSMEAVAGRIQSMIAGARDKGLQTS